MPTTPQQALRDPEFLGLPASDQRTILGQMDPTFSALPDDDQVGILARARTARGPAPEPNPAQVPGTELTGLPGVAFGPPVPGLRDRPNVIQQAQDIGNKALLPLIRAREGTIQALPEPGILNRIGGAIVGDVRVGDTALGRALGFATEPMENLTQPAPFVRAEALQLEDVVPGQGPVSQAAQGAVRGAEKFATGMTSPENALIMAATGGVGVLSKQLGKAFVAKAISAGFSVDMLNNAYHRYPEFRDAVNAGDVKAASESLMQMALEAGMSALSLRHAAEGTGGMMDREARPSVKETRKGAAAGKLQAEAYAADTPYIDQLAAMENPALAQELVGATDPAVKAVINREVARREASGRGGGLQQPAVTQNRPQRRATAEVPVTGEPETVAREKAAQRGVSHELTGKEYEELTAEERSVVDDMVDRGYVGTEPPAPPVDPFAPRVRPTVQEAVGQPAEAVTQPEAIPPPLEVQPTPAAAPPAPVIEEGAVAPGVLPETAAPVEPPSPGFLENLDTMGREADARLDKSGALRGLNLLGPVLDPRTSRDVALSIAGQIARGTLTFKDWSQRMVKVYGPKVKRHLQTIWDEAKSLGEPGEGTAWKPGMPLKDIDPTKISVPKTGAKLSVDDVARYLDIQTRNEHGTVPVDAPPEVKMERLRTTAREEMRQQLEKPESGAEWYSKDTQLADEHMAAAFPELRDNPTLSTFQKAISAVMSNNSTPATEAYYAAHLFDGYAKTGRIPLEQSSGKQWPAQGARGQLEKIQSMVDELGVDGFVDFITSRKTVAEVRKYRSGTDGKANDIVPGSLALGPKIGRYFLDLMGHEHEGSTVDKWDARGQYRRLGRLSGKAGIVESPTPESERPLFMGLHADMAKEFGLRNQSSAQSVLWHYEQDLYRRLGLEVKSTTRSQGTKRFLDERGISYGDDRNRAAQPGSPPSAGAERQQAGDVRGTPQASGSGARKGKGATAAAAPKPTLLERADKAGKEAGTRLTKRLGRTASMSAFVDPENIRDLAVSMVGSAARGTLTLDKLTKELVEQYGPRARFIAKRVMAEAERLAANPEEMEAAVRGPELKAAFRAPATTATAPAEKEEIEKTKPAAVKTAAAPVEPGRIVSPSYDKTKHKILEKVDVSDATKSELDARMADWEEKNPGRKKVTFEDVRNEAREMDPTLLLQLDPKRAQDAVILNPGLRFAAREMWDTIGDETMTRRERLMKEGSTLSGEERLQEQRKIDALEEDSRKMLDILLPARSQDGRNLVYHRMMAAKSFSTEYWLARAKKAMGLPSNVDLPDDVLSDIKTTVTKGRAAEQEAVAVVRRKRKLKGEAPLNETAPVATEALETAAKTRAEVVADKYKRLISTLEGAIKGEETAKVEPVTPEERAAWENEPAILDLRGRLADIRKEKRNLAAPDRAKVVEQQRKQFIARLQAQAAGKLVSANPVSRIERELWEQDPEVLRLRARIAKNRTAPTSEQRIERGTKRTLATLERKLSGEKPAPSDWVMTKEEREAIEADPRVRAIRGELAQKLADLDKDGWLETIIALRRAGLLTGPKTHLRNIGGNLTFAAIEEIARIPTALVDMAVSRIFKTPRSALGASPTAVFRAGREAATRGIREGGEVLRKGLTQGDLEKMELHRELNGPSPAANMYARYVFRTLGAADRVFKVYAYERSIQEQMKLAKVDTPTEAMKVQAVSDAEFATFNNRNIIASGISKTQAGWRREGPAGKAASAAVDLAAPFKNTPANLYARLIDYTPVGGAIKATAAAARAMKAKGWTPEQQRAFSQAIGRGATGTALIGLGWWLASKGLMQGTSQTDPGKRAVDEREGKFSGSVKLGDAWYQVSPFSPHGLLVTMGATLQREATKDISDEAKRPENIIGVAAETLAEQPLLKGFQDIASSVSEPGRRLSQFTGSVAGRFVPTLASDVAGLADTVRRETRGANLAETIGRGVAARVPGLRNTLPAKTDVYGETIPQEARHAIDPTLSRPSRGEKEPATAELIREGVGAAPPGQMKGEDLRAWLARKAVVGKFVKRSLDELVSSEGYKNLGRLRDKSEERKEELEKAIREARREVSKVTSTDEYKEGTPKVRLEMLRSLEAELTVSQ
jgi:hypothetical protein